MKKLAEFVIRYRWAVIVFFLALTAFKLMSSLS